MSKLKIKLTVTDKFKGDGIKDSFTLSNEPFKIISVYVGTEKITSNGYTIDEDNNINFTVTPPAASTDEPNIAVEYTYWSVFRA